jgi:hypothetical protein
MVTATQLFTKPISLCLLMLLFAPAPAMVWADPGAEAATDGAVAAPAVVPDWSPVGLAPVAGFRPADHSPRWFETTPAPDPAPAKTGSWWSRRTTAQKTWFVVGMVVGAAGIVAIASSGSGGGSSGGGY